MLQFNQQKKDIIFTEYNANDSLYFKNNKTNIPELIYI